MTKKQKLYQVTMSEEQLRMISAAVEDWHRFLSGQCELHNATSLLENYKLLQEELHKIQPLVTPELCRKYGTNSSYGWDGGLCPNPHQRKAIDMSYGIYREILHFFAVKSAKPDDWNVYTSKTLTCPEQGQLIKIEEICTTGEI